MNMLNIVGIDIRSVALSLVVIDEAGAVIHSSYQFHSGEISETLRLMLGNFDINTIGGLAMTHSGPGYLKN